jgi:hypothetical protein
MNNKKEFMLIPYEANSYGFTCKYFNFYPYHIMSFSTKTEDEMKSRISEYITNRVKYERKFKLYTNAASEFYQELNYKGD